MPAWTAVIPLIDASITASSSNLVVIASTDYPNGTFYFEIVGKVTSGTMTVSLRRNGTTTDDATLSFTETAFTRKRVSFTAGGFSYFIFISGGTGPVVNIGRVPILQSNSTTPTKTRCNFSVGNQELSKNNTAAAALTNPKYLTWDFGLFGSIDAIQVILVWSHSNSMGTFTAQFEEDNGSFAGWTTKTAIVSAATGGGGVTSTTVSVVNPVQGRHYRITAQLNDSMYTYNIYSATVSVRCNSSELCPIGDVTSLGTITHPCVTNLTDSRVAYIDSTNLSLRAYDFDGTSWTLVGSGLTITASGGTCSIAAMSSTRVAYIDNANNQLRAYDFNGSTWSLTGSGLTPAGFNLQSTGLCALSSTRVALVDEGNDVLRTYDFDGSNWSLVGSNFSITVVNPVLTKLSSSRIALLDTNNDSLRAYDFDGSNWSLVGSGLGISSVVGNRPALCAISSTKVFLFFDSNGTIRTYDFDGSNWALSGTAYIYGSGVVSGGTMSICALSSSAICLISTSIAAFMKLNWNSVTGIRMTSEFITLNTADGGTGLQGRQFLYDLAEWDYDGGSLTIKHLMDSDNASNSAKLVDITASSDVTSSAVTGANQQTSVALSPTSGNQFDSNVTNSTGVVASTKVHFKFIYAPIAAIAQPVQVIWMK